MSVPAVPGSTDLATARATFSEVGMELEPATTYDEWSEVGSVVGRIDKAHLWWIGDWVNFGERAYGEKYAQAIDETGLNYDTLKGCAWVSSRIEMVRRRTILSWSHHREVAALEPDEQDYWLDLCEEHGWSHKELRKRLRSRLANTPPLPTGDYGCIVIDPPWPMDKIVREVRPKQAAALDYPTMPLEQIEHVCGQVVTAQENAHIYLWTTQRFLPAAFDLFEAWDVSYECAMTWVKNVGPTPFSWMYDTEHVLFGRRGSLPLERKGQRLSFSAKAVGHSIKPDIFYERVVAASPGPRLAMFERGERDGFEVWGDEVAA